MSRPGNAAVNALLAIASAALTLLVVEAVIRAAGIGPSRGKTTAVVFNAGRELLLDCYPTDPRGYFDVDLRAPAVYARYEAAGVRRLDAARQRAPHCVEVRTNSAGFRGGEIAPPRAGVRRVAVLGDSFTEGQGVREEDTYARVVQGVLEGDAPGRWEVLNCGRRAADFPELSSMLDEVLALAPDLVVYAFVPNDAQKTPSFAAGGPFQHDLILDFQQASHARRYGRLGPFESRLLEIVRHRLETRELTAATLRWYRGMYGPPNAEGWEATRRHLYEMAERTAARGSRLVAVTWPLLLDGDPLADVHDEVSRALDAIGIAHHDLRDVLRGRPASSLHVHDVDMHPNELAHQLAGESLAPFVVSAFEDLRKELP